MEYITLLLLVANIGLVVYALTRINALYLELRTPIVKKLSSDMNLKPSNSRRPVGPQEMAARGNNARDNRNTNSNSSKDRSKDSRGTERREAQATASATAPATESREPREGRDRNREGRDRNRDGRDRNRGRDNRERNRERRPQEVMGNEGASESHSESAPIAPVSERPVNEGRPAFEARRPLEPRFQPEVQASEASVAPVAAPVVESSEAPEFDPSKMRHGRRSVVKKAPAFEDSTPAETTSI